MDKSQSSTNAVSASNLFRLGTLLSNPRYIHLAKGTINAFESEILQYPWLFASLLTNFVAAKLGVTKVNKGEEEKYHRSPRSSPRVLLVEESQAQGPQPGGVEPVKVADSDGGKGKDEEAKGNAQLGAPEGGVQVEGEQVKTDEAKAED